MPSAVFDFVLFPVNLVRGLAEDDRQDAEPPAPEPLNGGSSSATTPKVRKDFPETWIWTEKLVSAK